jgi:hypothetical protein
MLSRCRLSQLCEVSIEASTQNAALGFVGANTREHNEIKGRQRAVVAK